MQLLIATLCDSAADYQGKMVIMGTFDTMMARSYPAALANCRLALRLSASREEAGKHPLRIRFIAPDGSEAIQPLESEMDVRFSEEGKGLPFITRNLIFPVGGVRLPQSGVYKIEVSVDGEVKATLDFVAAEVQGKQQETGASQTEPAEEKPASKAPKAKKKAATKKKRTKKEKE